LKYYQKQKKTAYQIFHFFNPDYNKDNYKQNKVVVLYQNQKI